MHYIIEITYFRGWDYPNINKIKTTIRINYSNFEY